MATFFKFLHRLKSHLYATKMNPTRTPAIMCLHTIQADGSNWCYRILVSSATLWRYHASPGKQNDAKFLVWIWFGLRFGLNFSGVWTGPKGLFCQGPQPKNSFYDWLIPPRQMYLISRYSSMPYLEPSLPNPDCFQPPNGAISEEMIPSFTPTIPTSIASATRQIWLISCEKK